MLFIERVVSQPSLVEVVVDVDCGQGSTEPGRTLGDERVGVVIDPFSPAGCG